MLFPTDVYRLSRVRTYLGANGNFVGAAGYGDVESPAGYGDVEDVDGYGDVEGAAGYGDVEGADLEGDYGATLKPRNGIRYARPELATTPTV